MQTAVETLRELTFGSVELYRQAGGTKIVKILPGNEDGKKASQVNGNNKANNSAVEVLASETIIAEVCFSVKNGGKDFECALDKLGAEAGAADNYDLWRGMLDQRVTIIPYFSQGGENLRGEEAEDEKKAAVAEVDTFGRENVFLVENNNGSRSTASANGNSAPGHLRQVSSVSTSTATPTPRGGGGGSVSTPSSNLRAANLLAHLSPDGNVSLVGTPIVAERVNKPLLPASSKRQTEEKGDGASTTQMISTTNERRYRFCFQIPAGAPRGGSSSSRVEEGEEESPSFEQSPFPLLVQFSVFLSNPKDVSALGKHYFGTLNVPFKMQPKLAFSASANTLHDGSVIFTAEVENRTENRYRVDNVLVDMSSTWVQKLGNIQSAAFSPERTGSSPPPSMTPRTSTSSSTAAAGGSNFPSSLGETVATLQADEQQELSHYHTISVPYTAFSSELKEEITNCIASPVLLQQYPAILGTGEQTNFCSRLDLKLFLENPTYTAQLQNKVFVTSLILESTCLSTGAKLSQTASVQWKALPEGLNAVPNPAVMLHLSQGTAALRAPARSVVSPPPQTFTEEAAGEGNPSSPMMQRQSTVATTMTFAGSSGARTGSSIFSS